MLAIQHQQAGRHEDAERLYRQMISLDPSNPDVLNLLGLCLLERKKRQEAANLFRQAVAVRGDIAEYHVNLGRALQAKPQLKEAETALRRAIELKPTMASAWTNLGAALSRQERPQEAIKCYRRALEIDPDDADAHTNIGVSLFDMGQYEQAIVEHRTALKIRPDFPVAHLNLAMPLLLLGREEEGWEHYEWRSQCDGLPKHNFRQPMWDGSPLEGKTLMLYTEQGLGDAIQFARFVPVAARRGGRIAVVCQNELKSLFATVAGADEVRDRRDPLPDFDVYAPLMSLARIFKVRVADVPGAVPYLHADPALAAVWKRRLASNGAGLKVGLVWAGSPGHRKDGERSIRLEDYAPLAGIDGVTFYSLQKGAAAEQLRLPPAGLRIIDVASELKSMADTAACMQDLDLVISVDTSACHLAGALARPVWVLIPALAPWGWGLKGSTTSWYPTMRLFRQESPLQWTPAVNRVAEALQGLAGV
jgi:Flp pilus assembly protein TadD